MSTKISSRKAKGRRLQQWVCKKISAITGYEWGPDKPISSRPMGQSGTDVRLESQVEYAFPFSTECKAQENMSVGAWVKQAKENQNEGTDWLLFCKQSRKDPIVIMDAEAFFAIIAELNNFKKMAQTFAYGLNRSDK